MRYKITVALSAVLFIAVFTCLCGLGNVTFPRIGWYSSPIVQTLTITWELILGTLLLMKRFYPIAWLSSLLTFMTFTGISGKFVMSGVAVCRCPGVIHADPRYAFIIDMIAVVVLLVNTPTKQEILSVSFYSAIRDAILFLFTTLVLIGAIVFITFFAFGSVEIAIARLRGQSILHPDIVDLGKVIPGEDYAGKITVTNLLDHRISIMGDGDRDGCMSIGFGYLPVVLTKDEPNVLPVYFKVPDDTTSGFLTVNATILTNSNKQKHIHFIMTAQVQQHDKERHSDD